MSAVWMVARAGMRRRGRSVVFLVLLVAVVGGLVFASVVGARRMHSALARFNAASNSASVQVFLADPTQAQLQTFRRSPNVVAVAAGHAFYIGFPAAPNLTAAAAVDAALGTVVDRPRIVAGRLPNPNAVDEIAIGESLGAQLHLGVGDQLDADSYTPAQVAALNGGASDAGAPAGPKLRFRIVGIVRRPVDLGRTRGVAGILTLTPAFDREYSGRIGVFGTGLLVRTRHGAADVNQVGAAARRIFGPSPQFGVSSLADDNEGAQSAINVLAIALWIFAGIAAFAGVVAIGIVLAREIASSSVDEASLLALGFTRLERVAVRIPEPLFVTAGGAILAVIGAVAASPLFPIGVARRAEPHPGLHVDAVVLALGVLALATIVLTIAFVAARRATRSAVVRDTSVRRHTTGVAQVVARTNLPPTVSSGLGMALQRGRGRTALPLFSAFLGAVLGVLGITAVLVYTSNFDHLVATPRLYGWTWDFSATDTVSNEPSCTAQAFGLLAEPGIGAAAAICYGSANITLDGRGTNGWSFVPLRGTIAPEVIAGRAPHEPGDVALGSATLRALHKHLGDRVSAKGPHGSGQYRIVGEAVFPSLGQPQPLADGAAFTATGFAPLFDQNDFYRYLVGRFTPGSDGAAVERRIAAIPQLSDVTSPTYPVEIDRLRQIDWTPVSLAVMLGGLGLVAVAHALITAVRRRRHDIAILKTLGFDRAQARATIAWQATTLGAVGLVVGIPAGLIVGRLAWRLTAESLGVAATAGVSTLSLLVTIVAVLVVVNLVAFFPARAAARTRPAIVLRTE